MLCSFIKSYDRKSKKYKQLARKNSEEESEELDESEIEDSEIDENESSNPWHFFSASITG